MKEHATTTAAYPEVVGLLINYVFILDANPTDRIKLNRTVLILIVFLQRDTKVTMQRKEVRMGGTQQKTEQKNARNNKVPAN
jgi:hypothetical protein